MEQPQRIRNRITGRRRFFKMLGISGIGLAGLPLSEAAKAVDDEKPDDLDVDEIVDSPPVLQCPSENGVTVVWAVKRQALGAVQYGIDKQNLDRTAFGDVLGLKANHDRFLQIRLDGLEANRRYFYRTVTTPFIFHHGHKLEAKEPVYGDIHSFETSGSGKSTGSFSVINDTHNNQPTLKRLMKKIGDLESDYTIWNGDAISAYDNPDQAVDALLRPGGATFAAEKPLLFVPGNHDYRGVWARNLPLAIPFWDHSAPEDRKMTRNFVVRTGSLALIGLDTGEDKPDWHPAWSGQALFEPYRIAQRDWLERTLKSREVASAPFVVTFAHIPIFDARPDANGGDVLERWAQFQRHCGALWGPLLNRYGVQLHIAAHVHRFRFDAATGERTWAQLVGGGHEPKGQITVIHGRAGGDRLEVIVNELNSQTELGRWSFPKRRTS